METISVTHLLNQGAILMAQGRFKDGFECTRLGMAQIVQVFEATTTTDPSASSSSSSIKPDLRAAPLGGRMPQQETSPTMAFVYPFLVDTCNVYTSWNMIIPVALYNMALAHHRELLDLKRRRRTRSASSSSSSSSLDHQGNQQQQERLLLGTLRDMYRQALAAWEHVFCNSDSNDSLRLPDESLLLVHLAILNNLIHVEQQFITSSSRDNNQAIVLELQQEFCQAFLQLTHAESDPFFQHFDRIFVLCEDGSEQTTTSNRAAAAA